MDVKERSLWEFVDEFTKQLETDDEIAERTVSAREQQVTRFLDWAEDDVADGVPGGEVADYHITRFVKKLQREGYANATVNGHLYAVSRFLGHVCSVTPLDNPMDDVETKHLLSQKTKKEQHSDSERQGLRENEVQELVENVRTPIVRNKLLVSLMYDTGMRPHEASNVRIGDLDREDRELTVRDDKTESRRLAFYGRQTQRLLEEWLDGGRRAAFTSAEDSDRLFISRKKGVLSPNMVNKVVVNAAEAAGLQEVMYEDAAGNERKRITGHVLRHSAGSRMVDEGMDLETVRRLLGHSDVQVTQVYVSRDDDDLRDAYRNHDPSL